MPVATASRFASPGTWSYIFADFRCSGNGISGLPGGERYLAAALKAFGFEAYTISAATKKLRTVIMMMLVIRRDRRRRAI